MSKRITRWNPDSCECVIEYSWDDSDPAGVVFTAEKIVPCSAHTLLVETGGIGPAFETILAENRAFAAKRNAS